MAEELEHAAISIIKNRIPAGIDVQPLNRHQQNIAAGLRRAAEQYAISMSARCSSQLVDAPTSHVSALLEP